jgi:hypothetical protein
LFFKVSVYVQWKYLFTYIICQSWGFYIMTSTDLPSSVLVTIKDEVKPAKTTNSDEKVAVNEDAGCYDRPLDVGKHYVVRRLDGSLRE